MGCFNSSTASVDFGLLIKVQGSDLLSLYSTGWLLVNNTHRRWIKIYSDNEENKDQTAQDRILFRYSLTLIKQSTVFILSFPVHDNIWRTFQSTSFYFTPMMLCSVVTCLLPAATCCCCMLKRTNSVKEALKEEIKQKVTLYLHRRYSVIIQTHTNIYRLCSITVIWMLWFKNWWKTSNCVNEGRAKVKGHGVHVEKKTNITE